jgi:hypothetical protein
MSARMRRQGPDAGARGRAASDRGSATVVPLLLCVAALTIAALILGMIATGLAHRPAPAAPPWSGDQAPPGAVGLSPEQSVLQGSGGPGADQPAGSTVR